MCKYSLLICFSRGRCLFNWGSVRRLLHFSEGFQASVQILPFSLLSHVGRLMLVGQRSMKPFVPLSVHLSVRPSVTKFF